MATLGSWGVRYLPAVPAFAARSVALGEGGPRMLASFMEELRHIHLGAPAPRRSVLAELERAYVNAAEARVEAEV
jgi:hypothetical protein